MLLKLENFDIRAVKPFACDLLIVYACEESRASHILLSDVLVASEIFVIGESEQSSFKSERSGDYKGEVWPSALDALRLIIKKCTPSKIGLDISCMPRTVMAAVFAELVTIAREHEIELIALYSLAAFSSPPEVEEANESIEPVHSAFAGWSSPEGKPISLVIGLGYERQKAEGASEFFEPSDQWVFVPNSPIEEFLTRVELNNRNLLDKTDRGRLISYQVEDPESTYGQLELVVSSLSRYSNPVLLPFGPKIFFFLTLVLCLSHPELGVWRVTGRDKPEGTEIQASGEIIGVRCIFGPSHTARQSWVIGVR